MSDLHALSTSKIRVALSSAFPKDPARYGGFHISKEGGPWHPAAEGDVIQAQDDGFRRISALEAAGLKAEADALRAETKAAKRLDERENLEVVLAEIAKTVGATIDWKNPALLIQEVKS